MNSKIKINTKNIIAVLIMMILILACFIWYGELGTNREAPKKAKFVSNFILGSDNHK
jgi:hypothetical protein